MMNSTHIKNVQVYWFIYINEITTKWKKILNVWKIILEHKKNNTKKSNQEKSWKKHEEEENKAKKK